MFTAPTLKYAKGLYLNSIHSPLFKNVFVMKIWEYRQQLMEAVNEAGNITLSVNGKKYAARIAGSKLDYPFIWARHEDGHDIECEITWPQVERMKEGTITNIRKS